MKKLYILASLSLIFNACFHFPYGKIINQYDDFKKEDRKSVLFNERFKAIETNISGLNKYRSFIFNFTNIKKFGNSEKNLLIFSFDLAPNEFIDSNFFILAGQELHELRFYDKISSEYIHRSENFSTSTSTKTTTEAGDENSLQTRSNEDISGSKEPKTITKTEVEVKNNTDVSETNRKKIVTKAFIPDDLMEKIANSDKLKIRVYLNERGFTYEFTQPNLEKIRKFYLTGSGKS